jgi:tRNA-2-methylthio-N6-dimethylallyladenosine synthase
VPEEAKDERLQALQALLREQQFRFNHGMVGRTIPVLLEKPGRDPGQLLGRSPWLQPVHLEAPAADMGRIVEVAVRAATATSLSGRLAAPVLEDAAA